MNIIKNAKNTIKELVSGKQSPKPIKSIIDGREVDNLVEYVKQLVSTGRDARDNHTKWSGDGDAYNFEDSMLNCLRLYIGKHYEAYSSVKALDAMGLTDPPNQYTPENHIFPVVEVITGIVTANRPGFQWKASADPNDTESVTLADNISKAFDIYNQNMGIQDWYPSSVREAFGIYGHKLLMLEHCFEKDATYGKPRIRELDPLSIFFNPGAKEWETAKYRGAVIIEEKLKVKAQWENFYGNLGINKKIKLRNNNDFNTTEAKHWDIQYKNDEYLKIKDNIDRGITIYMEYDDMTRVPVINKESYTDPITNETVEREVEDANATERKYPNGRLIVICEDDLIYDGQPLGNPYEHGNSMLIYLPGLKVNGYLLGMGYTHLFWDIQRNINESVTYINENNKETAFHVTYYDADALGDDFAMTNLSRRIFGVNSKNMKAGFELIKRAIVPDNTGQAYNRYAELVQAMYRIAGIEEAVRGISKSGDSGKKVENLFQNATNRFRPHITQCQEYLLEPYANNLMKNMVQFQVNDTMSIGEDYQDTTQSVKLYDSLKMLKDKKIELQLRLVVGTATPDQRSFMAQETIAYKQLLPNSIPDDVVLINSDIPQLQKIGIQMKQQRELQIRNQAMLAEAIPAIAEMVPKMQEIIATFDEARDQEDFKEMLATVAGAVQVMQTQKQVQTQTQQAQQ